MHLHAPLVPMTNCPDCGAKLKPSNLDRHLRDKCLKNPERIRAEARRKAAAARRKARKKKAAARTKRKQKVAARSAPSPDLSRADYVVAGEPVGITF